MKFKNKPYNMESHLLADFCWVMAGSQRKKIIKVLNSEKIPSQIQKETGIQFCNVSRVLKSMVERELVECLSFEEKYRLYRLTSKGYQIKNKIFDNLEI